MTGCECIPQPIETNAGITWLACNSEELAHKAHCLKTSLLRLGCSTTRTNLFRCRDLSQKTASFKRRSVS